MMAIYHLYLLLVPLLQAFWVVPAHSYVHDNREFPLTAAPILNQLDKRQASDQVTCSQWSIFGGGVPVCSTGRTCIFNYDIPYWGCYPSIQTGDVFVTECNNWPTTNSAAGDQTLYCPQSAPSCGMFVLENTVGGTFTNLGCSAVPYALTATQVEAFTGAINAGTTTDNYIPTSTASPVTVTVTATGASSTNAAPVVSTTTPLPTSSLTSSSPASSTSSTPSGGGGSSGSTSSNAATIGGAVGGAVGGLALIAAAIFIWLYMRKQRRKAAVEQSSKEPGIQSPGPSPYSASSAPYSPKGQLANC